MATERQMYCKEIDFLRQERDSLQEQIDRKTLSAESMSSEMVKYYTGLPNYGVFSLVHKLCHQHLSKSRTKLTTLDELLMTLMRLRLNLPIEDLAFRFHISKSTVSDIFYKWLNVMYVRLKPFVNWVPKETVMVTLPNAFKADFKFCMGIFDCSEIYIEQPVKRKARAQTWSNYKRHNTVIFCL